MLSAAARIVLTSTAIAPVGLTYSWIAFEEGYKWIPIIILGSCILLIIICISLLRFARRNLEVLPFSVQSIEAADKENTAFLLLYLLPLFTDKFGTLNWSVWVPTLLIFGVLTATGYNYHFNPLITLLGWHFYKVESTEGVTYVIITKKQLRSAFDDLKVGQLTEYILLDIGG